MRVDDLTVEVRDRNLKRVGQVTPLSLDLKARTKWCNVGEWTLTLPGDHPMVPYLSEPGSGILVTGPEGVVVHPPTYSAWAVTLRNRVPNPLLLSGGGAWVASPVAGTYASGKYQSVTNGTSTHYQYPAPLASDAVGGRFAVTPGDLMAMRARVNNPNPYTIWARIGSGWYQATGGSVTTDGTVQGPIVEIPAGGSAVLEVSGVVPNGVSGTLTGHLPLVYFYGNSGGGVAPNGQVGATDEWALYTGSSVPPAPIPFIVGGTLDEDLRRIVWTAGANASPTVQEERGMTAPAWQEMTYGPLFSGPTRVPARVRNAQNPDGTYTFSGVTDEILLQGARAFPDPTIADPQASSQSKERDERTGSTEDLLRAYVAWNITSTHAPLGRRRGLRKRLVLQGSSLGRGLAQSKSPRFQNLLELLQEMIAYDPDLGFRVVQVGSTLEFQVLDARDRTKFVRFDIENGTITSEEVQSSGPIVTDAFAAGQGEGKERTIVRRQTPESIAAEEEWGVVFEEFIDQRDTDDLAELEQSGDERLQEGQGGTAVKMVPSDDTTMQVNVDWRQGDSVTTVVSGIETVARVTEVAYSVTAAGVMAGAALGDVSGFTQATSESSKVQSLDQRISNLERSGGLMPARLAEAGREVTDWNAATEAGFYWSGSTAANGPATGTMLSGVVRPGLIGSTVVLFQEVRRADDPNQATAFSRYRNASGTWTPWRLNGLGRGPSTLRTAVTPQYWDMWNDTDGDTGLYVGSKTGTWRRFSGYVGGTAKAWDASGASGTASIYGRTEAFTIPTVLEANEYLVATPVALGTGYATMGVVAIVRNPTNTTFTVRLMQFLNSATQPINFIWQIAQY